MKPLIKRGIDPDMKQIAHSFLSLVVPKNSPNAQNKKKKGSQFAKSNKAKLLSQSEKFVFFC